MNCRHCHAELTQIFLDLGLMPPSNAYLSAEALHRPERVFPLKIYVCEQCWLVQTEDFVGKDELFSPDYAYFSSISESWLAHSARYAAMISRRLSLSEKSFVIEIASNDGYLLKNFVAANIPCLGIEPTASTAAAASTIGVPVLREFFGKALAKTLNKADLIIGNNVYAHVPDINDFTLGLKAALKPGGTITLEFPHLMRLIEHVQFDTVYHEHFSYLSLFTVSRMFAAAGLRIFDVEELPTHGGSVRVYGCHAEDARQTTSVVTALLSEEEKRGLRSLAVYRQFQARADKIRDDLRRFLKEKKKSGHSVAAYGAAAKGNTLLNYAGITTDLLPYVCDITPAKQGKYLPGSHLPILPPEIMAARRPEYVLLLPWNLKEEIMRRIGEWGPTFVVAIPRLTEYSYADSKKTSAVP
jgi:SAM-dependent methyltransferase